jgi:hypothetical protein
MIDGPYQGNGWWIFFGLGSVFMLYRVLSEARSKRKARFPVDTRAVISACILLLGFCALALFQVLTH